MKTYYVYSTKPELLFEYGEVYEPRIRMSYVLLKTELSKVKVWNLEGVYEVNECEEGMLKVLCG